MTVRKLRYGAFLEPRLGIAVVLALALALTASPRAQKHEDDNVREVGPEDGALCCSGLVPFLFHEDEVLTSTGRAGIFRSESRGERWQRSMTGLVGPDGVSPFVDDLCQAPSDSRIVYAITETTNFVGTLFLSSDFGKTWNRRAVVGLTGGFPLCRVDADDARTVYVSDAGVEATWKSKNGGQTVQTFVTNLPECAAGAQLAPRPGGILYVDGGHNCRYVSTDGGNSFRALAEPPSFESSFNVSPDGRTIFISTRDASNNSTGTFRSTDGGASYVAVTGLPNLIPGFTLAFDPTNQSRIYANDGLMYVSTDGGSSFTRLPASNDRRFLAPILQIYVDRFGSVYLDTFGGPFRTDDGGRTFRSLLDGFRASIVNDLAFDADGKLLVGTQNTHTLFQQTQDLEYRAIGDTLPRPFGTFAAAASSVAGSPTDPDVILAATIDLGLVRTGNGGRSWKTASGLPGRLVRARMAFPTSSRVYLAFPTPITSAGPGLYRSEDEGRSFARLSSLPFGALAVDPTNPDVLYVGTFNGSAGLFKSTDGGQTLQGLGQPGTFSAIAVDRLDSNVVYAGERFGQVLRSVDGGNTFAPANAGLAGAGVEGLAQDVRGTLYVWLNGGGLFASGNFASSWRAVDTGEALRRSPVVGRGALLTDPRQPGRVYLGNAGVIQIDDANRDE